MKNKNADWIVKISMLSAVATVLMLLEFPLPFIAPSFYEIDFSEVPALIGAFAMGPLAGVVIEAIKILLNFFNRQNFKVSFYFLHTVSSVL